MGKLRIENGGISGDVLSPDEFDAGVDKLAGRITAGLWRPPIRRRFSGTLTSDANGNLGGALQGGVPPNPVRLDILKPGERCVIQRFSLDAPGATPAAPLTAGWIRLSINEASIRETVLMVPNPASSSSGVVAPYHEKVGSGDGIDLGSDEDLYAWGAGLTASTTYAILLQLLLYPNPERLPGEPSP